MNNAYCRIIIIGWNWFIFINNQSDNVTLIILFKSIKKEIKCAIHPNITHKITLNKRPVEHNVIRSVNVYMAAYVVIFAISILIVSMDNFDFTTNFTAVSATINNIGPGLGKVGPYGNFAEFSNFSKLVFCFNMIAGRLEIIPMLVLINPKTWSHPFKYKKR